MRSSTTSLIPTSFGYFNPFMLDAAKKYPKVEFRHPTGLWNKDKDPMNAGGYYSYMDQGHYVNGVAAGLSTKTNKIGYIAAKPIGLVLRNVNSFTVGVEKAKSVRRRSPDHHRGVVLAGSRGGVRRRL